MSKQFKVTHIDGTPYDTKNKVWTIGSWKSHCKYQYKMYILNKDITDPNTMNYNEWYLGRYQDYKAEVIGIIREETMMECLEKERHILIPNFRIMGLLCGKDFGKVVTQIRNFSDEQVNTIIKGGVVTVLGYELDSDKFSG